MFTCCAAGCHRSAGGFGESNDGVAPVSSCAAWFCAANSADAPASGWTPLSSPWIRPARLAAIANRSGARESTDMVPVTAGGGRNAKTSSSASRMPWPSAALSVSSRRYSARPSSVSRSANISSIVPHRRSSVPSTVSRNHQPSCDSRKRSPKQEAKRGVLSPVPIHDQDDSANS